jgi:ABC-type Fe3+-hydroxamate transport system substrate-binding protein
MPAYKRIISLVPSLTELVIDLGLSEQLEGRTRFCVRPEQVVKDIPIIGGTKNPRVDKILDMNPDFIIANKEENREEDVCELREKSSAHVEITDISTIDEALNTIDRLGTLLNSEAKALKLAAEINKELHRRPGKESLRTAYFIWKEPWMSAGSDTYIHDVLKHWNLENVFGHLKRYPTVELEQLAAYEPEIIILSSEPYPFREKHIGPVQRVCPDARILLMDGQWFSWYGSRMLPSFAALNRWRSKVEVPQH